MIIKDIIKKKIFGILGLARNDDTPKDVKERTMFLNDAERLARTRIREYNIWYEGDGDALLNYYTKGTMIDFQIEPIYSRNKRSYFWSISATENDVKRTHSGQARNIVDTMVNIVKFPQIKGGTISDENNKVNENLQKILKKSELKRIYKNKQMPLTLVEGWGCYKINWDMDVSEYPYPVYYRAEQVEFIKRAGQIVGIIFKDYYTTENGKNYMLIETRRTKHVEEEDVNVLVIEKELYRADESGEYLNKAEFSEVPELIDINEYIEIGPTDMLLAVPSIFFEDTSPLGLYGRSIFTGKIDLLDDLDQVLSQSANTVRRSTAIEYFNTDFLERDAKTGMPVQPKAYDRKYIMFKGGKNAEGGSTASDPVQVAQPQLNISQYSIEAQSILLQIINGIMSPATLGIDIAKKDNAEAQREKEKVTIFTRNTIVDAETDVLKSLCSQLLCAYEFMNTGKITVKEYDISVIFSEFADDSFENKLEALGKAYDNGIISEEMYMRKLYGDTLTVSEKEAELKWLKEHHTDARLLGMKGILGANTPQNDDMNEGYEAYDEEYL